MKKIFFVLLLFSACETGTDIKYNTIIQVTDNRNGYCTFVYYGHSSGDSDMISFEDSCNKHAIGDTILFGSPGK